MKQNNIPDNKTVHSSPAALSAKHPPAPKGAGRLKPYIENITNPDLKSAVIRVEQDLDALSVPYGAISAITINPRYTRRFGSATRSWNHTLDEKGMMAVEPIFHIEVSSAFFQPGVPAFGLYENLLHEYIHTIPGCMNHGSTWKKFASYINTKLHTHITTTTSPKTLGLEQVQEDKARYILECEDCGNRITKSRICSMVVHPEQYCCKCGGQLHLIKGEVPQQYIDNENLLPDRKYAVQCTRCHQILYRQRMSRLIQHPEDYICACGGRFKRIR